MSLPQTIEIPGAAKLQSGLVSIGIVTGLLSFGAFAAEDGGAGLIVGAISAGFFWAASKVRTTRRLIGGVYR